MCLLSLSNLFSGYTDVTKPLTYTKQGIKQADGVVKHKQTFAKCWKKNTWNLVLKRSIRKKCNLSLDSLPLQEFHILSFLV